MTQTEKRHTVYDYRSYLVVHGDGSSWRLRELDSDTMHTCFDGHCSVFRINGDELHKLNWEGEWFPVNWEEDAAKQEVINPELPPTSINLSDESLERPD